MSKNFNRYIHSIDTHKHSKQSMPNQQYIDILTAKFYGKQTGFCWIK